MSVVPDPMAQGRFTWTGPEPLVLINACAATPAPARPIEWRNTGSREPAAHHSPLTDASARRPAPVRRTPAPPDRGEARILAA